LEEWVDRERVIGLGESMVGCCSVGLPQETFSQVNRDIDFLANENSPLEFTLTGNRTSVRQRTKMDE
jgi:hypothetical protein